MLGGFPAGWGEFGDSAGGMRADTVNHVAEIRKRVDLAKLATGDEAVHDRGPPSAGVAAGKQPISAADDNRTSRKQDALRRTLTSI